VRECGVGRLAGVATGLEARRDRLGVARRQRPLVVGGGSARAHPRIGRQQRRPLDVPAGQRHRAVVDPQLLEPAILTMVGDHRVRQRRPPAVGVEADHHLLEAAALADDALDVLDLGVARGQPLVRFGDEAFELRDPFDPPPLGMEDHRLGHEGPDQRLELAREDPRVVGHREPLAPLSLLQPDGDRLGEKLGRPGHGANVPHRAGLPRIFTNLIDSRNAAYCAACRRRWSWSRCCAGPTSA
jgi:hypothetical protein